MLIAHLSDPHLRLHGHLYQDLVDSNAMFLAAIRQVAGLDPQPDLLLPTGDIVDKGLAEESAVAAGMLALVHQPVLAIPGNHDDREAFRACFREHGSGPLHLYVGDRGPVRIIGLDVTVPSAHRGDRDDAACLWLEQRLAEAPDRPTILMMHQPPFESGIPYIGAHRCLRGERLAAIV